MKKNKFSVLGMLSMVLAFSFVLSGCVTARAPTAEVPAAEAGWAQSVTDSLNVYKEIPVEVTGIPYEFKDIIGNRKIDGLLDQEYANIFTWQAATMVNFRINKFVLDFKGDGSLAMSTFYSYDQTPSDGGRYYSAMDNKDHVWNLQPLYHSHSGGNCSLDRYDDIAIAQAKITEMRKDPSLDKVYRVLLSVAEDMDYNYPAIGRNAGFVRLPNGREPLKGVCDDYARLLIDRLTAANINGVSTIQKVTGQNHAWVTLVYKGKTLYLDATWFDKNNIDENGIVDHTPYKDPCNMTFDNEIFTNHNQHHIAGGTRNIGS